MDTAALVARIDRLLKAGASPPPDRVLEKVADILTKARSGAGTGDDDLLSSTRSSRSSAASTMASALTASAMSADSQASTRRSYRADPPAAASASTALATRKHANDDSLGFMSLQLGKGDDRQERTLTLHRERSAKMKPVVDVRDKQMRQFQALLEGRGGKIVHMDNVKSGATQIGGGVSYTPSMCAGEWQFGGVASKLAAGGPPMRRNLPSDFHTA